MQILNTTHLLEYIVRNINKDKERLAATAQFYIAEGLYEITLESLRQLADSPRKSPLFISGGVSNNKIITTFFESHGAWKNKKIPRGDAGLSVGQIFYYFLN